MLLELLIIQHMDSFGFEFCSFKYDSHVSSVGRHSLVFITEFVSSVPRD